MEHKKARRSPAHLPFSSSSQLKAVPGIPPKPCFRAWPGSRSLLTLGPLSLGQPFALGLLVGGALCGRLHARPHNSQSPVDTREELATFSTFLCRWHCMGWRLEAGAVDSEITRAAQEKKLPKGYRRKPGMNYPSGLVPSPQLPACQAAVSPSPAVSPTSCCFPSLPLLPPKVQEDFIPFRELLVFPGSGDDSFSFPWIFSMAKALFSISSPSPQKEQKATFGLLAGVYAELLHPIHGLGWGLLQLP